MYIRPPLKVRPGPKLQFVTENRSSGATASRWIPVYDHVPIIPNGTPGRVGEIVDAMRRGSAGVNHAPSQPWTPPYFYEYIAKFGEASDAYVAKCKAWFDANPYTAPQPRPPPPEIDRELIGALFAKYPGQRPPFEERIKVYRAAGRSEEFINRAIILHERFLATDAERQAVIDRIFPNTQKKTPVKKPAKVIKAVKKKMPS